jgi:hypothetical protein
MKVGGNMKVKAETLSYCHLLHGIFCGRAKFKILEGPDKDEVIEIPVVYETKVGQVVELNKGDS